ncbi:MAG: hypothetical protein J3Q66DRAFT_440609 [Benniella sp.]|nr:MAG: hypothetical protein J3Q66DRAFT_440609 [Benniella sp.]
MVSTACSKALGLPELLELVSPYLAPVDLLACIQVNNLWHQFFIPALWYTIDDSLQSWERILFTCHSDQQQYGTRIRVRKFRPSNIADGKDEAWSEGYSRNLDIDIGQNGENLYWGRKLRGVDNSVANPLGQVKSTALRDQEDLRDQTTIMERLEIKFSDIIQHTFKGVFEPPKRLQQLIKGFLTEEELKEGLLFTQNYWNLVLDNPGLQRSRLSREAILQWPVRSDDFFYKILSGMKNLREVDAIEFLALKNVWDLHDVAPSVEKIEVISSSSNNTDLRRVRAQDVTYFSVRQLGLSSTLPPYLRVLKIDTMKDDVLESVATHCKSLEVLEWMRDPAFIDEVLHRRPQQDGLHRFLVSCSTLKVFNGVERYVKADDMIREPWACLGIEKLRFRIVGIERLTQDEQTIYDGVVAANPRYRGEGIVLELGDEERAVIQKFERGREQQQQVYETSGY